MFLRYSYEAARALGRDELESDAEKDAAGRYARRQSAIRGEEDRGGNLAGSNGNATGQDALGRPHSRRTRSSIAGAEGKYRFFFINIIDYVVAAKLKPELVLPSFPVLPR